MKKTQLIMGMPVMVEIRSQKSESRQTKDIKKVFDYFRSVDEKYSPFKENSEVGKYNRKEQISSEYKKIIKLCEETNRLTNGYFDIVNMEGRIDPSGLVKGWAIKNASNILKKLGYKHYYVDAGGDAEIVGEFTWGIRNPFDKSQNVKIIKLINCGIATSGTYERGQHIWNPISKETPITDIISLTVIGKNVYEADRFATAAFAMGREGINFIEKTPGLEGYMIDNKGIATLTSKFANYVLN